VRGLVIIAGFLLLAGCGAAGSAVPSPVQAAMDAPFPDDGQIHVQSRGRFVIRPETMSCRAPRQIEKSLAAGAPRFLGPGLGEASQKSAGVSGSLGEIVDGRSCTDDGVNIVDHWQLLLNRAGKPYKLVLATWQGDVAGGGGAYWVGGVERDWDRRPPPFNEYIPLDMGARLTSDQNRKLQTERMTAFDIAELSCSFQHFVSAKGCRK
jgi:hypothetical protein